MRWIRGRAGGGAIGVLRVGLLILSLVGLATFREVPAVPAVLGESGVSPLPWLHAMAERLDASGRSMAASMAFEFLRELAVGEQARRAYEERLAQLPTLDDVNRDFGHEDAAALLEGEEQLGSGLGQLPEEERTMLWGLTLEPALQEGLRCRLLRMLDRFDPDPEALGRVIDSDARASSWEAAVLLGRRGRPEDRRVLEGALRRWRNWGRQYAIIGLVLLGEEAAAPAIREAADDTSPSVRRHVVLALAELGVPEDRILFEEIAHRLPDPPTLRVVLHGKKRLGERFPTLP